MSKGKPEVKKESNDNQETSEPQVTVTQDEPLTNEDSSDLHETVVQSPVSDDAIKKQSGTNEPGFLKRTFKNVAGVAISGSLLTAGVATFVEMGSIWSDMSLTQQFINTASTLSGHLAVWSVAMASGALGWGLGKSFDSAEAKFKPRAASAGVGLALIAASFAMPLNERVNTNVNDTLSRVFGVSSEAKVSQTLEAEKQELSSVDHMKLKPVYKLG
jgi:hypothetical protein